MHFLSVPGRTTLSQNVTGFWQDLAFNMQKLHYLKMQDEMENDSFLTRADSELILDSQNFKWISVLLFTWISGCRHAMCNELKAVFKIDVISFFFCTQSTLVFLEQSHLRREKEKHFFWILYILKNVSKLSVFSLFFVSICFQLAYL